MKTLLITEDELISLLRNTYNNASISTENYLNENPGCDYPTMTKASDFLKTIIPNLNFK